MNIKTSVELITPETAECWLEGNTGNRNINIYKTYASLVTFKIEDMTSASRAFVKQVDSSKVSVRSSVFDVFTRALKVFKSGESIVNRITCTDSDIDSAKAYARSVIKKAIEATP